MDPDESILNMSFHIRHSSKVMQQITNKYRKERQTEKRPSNSQKQYMKLLVDVWKTLPDEEKPNYQALSGINQKKKPKDFNSSSSPNKTIRNCPKENINELNNDTHAFHRSNTGK
ncbi:unnamed protein product [Blepharisma stoltei]|uniref:Uncharacterized protein n=1 Tax=Blepharisma stoltei TaxID=1481888 RepID=A0AAU9K7K8_9CILI|nr:unnamed protein product [Blepharisma stoltei]